MTGEGAAKQGHYETSCDVDVWFVTGRPPGEHLGWWFWDGDFEPPGWFFSYAMNDENDNVVLGAYTDADHRAIAAAKPTGSPVVRLEVTA